MFLARLERVIITDLPSPKMLLTSCCHLFSSVGKSSEVSRVLCKARKETGQGRGSISLIKQNNRTGASVLIYPAYNACIYRSTWFNVLASSPFQFATHVHLGKKKKSMVQVLEPLWTDFLAPTFGPWLLAPGFGLAQSRYCGYLDNESVYQRSLPISLSKKYFKGRKFQGSYKQNHLR